MLETITTPTAAEPSLPRLERWHSDPYLKQLARAALAQANLEEEILADNLLDYIEDLCAANGDDELLEDVLDRLPIEYRKQHGKELCSDKLALVMEWFERASEIDPEKAIYSPKSEDHYSTIGQGNGGSHIDYRDEVKEQWRLVWRTILAGLSTREERSQMKVLCLPSPQVWPEVRHYLELGFKAENIFGVEGGDAEARRVFKLNAERYGITPIIGRLENILAKRDEKFDVVLLDFLGPMSTSLRKITSMIKIADRALIGFNLMGARETNQVQAEMRYSASLMGIGAEFLDLVHEDIGLSVNAQHFDNTKNAFRRIAEATELKEIRNFVSVPALLSSFKGDAREHQPLFAELLDQLSKEEQGPAIKQFTPELQAVIATASFAALVSTFDDSCNVPKQLAFILKSMCALSIRHLSELDQQPTFIQNVGYLSRISGKTIPYLSTFALMERIPENARQLDTIANVLVKAMVKELLRQEVYGVPCASAYRYEREPEPQIVLHFASGQIYKVSLVNLQRELQELNESMRGSAEILRAFPFSKQIVDRVWLNL